MRRKFHTLDVFTETALAGNSLAVVIDCEGLDDKRMQAIAREFNLAETVFVFEPHDPVNTARLRIFTPGRELQFAGHPTIGTAVLLAKLRAPELLVREDLRIVVEEGVGDIVCVARHRPNQAPAAYFTLPRLPEPIGEAPPVEALALLLGLAPADIGFGAHRPSVYSAGTPFMFVPIADRAALAKARPNANSWGENGGPAVYLYTSEAENAGSSFRARMFAAGWGVVEDPATGSAVAAFAGALMRFARPADGDSTYVIEQGFEMGRPSLISLGLEVENGSLRAATIGGSAIMICEGAINA
ncbi:MAG TPA: PhzF family phenazine biosynthesis protein [Roseiarcus sp.]|jgi:trans-2,3-dihydro-3-hydroxyanthranilate isomerase|nr:PhzF family phenazine biosynthesis protein [Roseiarcus sp.]